VWKPIDPGHGFHDGNAEVAQYRVNRLIGGYEVPETVYASNSAGESGSCQAFVPNADTPTVQQVKDNKKNVTDSIIATDIICGQGDRHWGNILVDRNKTLVAVDNGHASFYGPENIQYIMSHNVLISSLFAPAEMNSEFVLHARRIDHGRYVISPVIVDRLRAVARERYDRAFIGIGTERHVNPENGWANLQMIIEKDGVIEW
jgi:hypothetical protein